MSKVDRGQLQFSTFVFCGITVSGQLSLNPRVLELHLLALQRKDVLALPTQGISRVSNKLTLCFNPELTVIPTRVTSDTGLVSSLLDDQSVFNEGTITILKCFIKRLQPPVCLLSYDGNLAGLRVLKNELRRLNDNFDDVIYCASIQRSLRSFLPRYDSYGIQNVYKVLYGQTADIMTAEENVTVMVAIVTKVLPCITWIDQNYVPFNSL